MRLCGFPSLHYYWTLLVFLETQWAVSFPWVKKCKGEQWFSHCLVFFAIFYFFLVSFFDSFVFPIKSMVHLEFIFTAYFGMRKNSNFILFFPKWKVSNLPIIYWRFPFFPQWSKLPSKILYESPLIMGQLQNSYCLPLIYY